MGKLIQFDSARRAQQDQFLDLLIAGRLPNQPKSVCSNPLSLRPDELLMFGCVVGDPTAKAIRDSWKFSESIRIVDSRELDELSVRCYTTFSGREAAE
jgi:hypothetical protein